MFFSPLRPAGFGCLMKRGAPARRKFEPDLGVYWGISGVEQAVQAPVRIIE